MSNCIIIRVIIIFESKCVLPDYELLTLGFPFINKNGKELTDKRLTFCSWTWTSTKFKSIKVLNRALTRTLNFIKEKLGDNISPSVLWTGNGYHIYLPVSAFILELESIFAGFEEPSRQFIRWTEQFLTNNKADPCHSNSLSFRNCMVRVPGSFNSKLAVRNEKGKIVNIPESAEVKIIQHHSRLV